MDGYELPRKLDGRTLYVLLMCADSHLREMEAKTEMAVDSPQRRALDELRSCVMNVRWVLEHVWFTVDEARG